MPLGDAKCLLLLIMSYNKSVSIFYPLGHDEMEIMHCKYNVKTLKYLI